MIIAVDMYINRRRQILVAFYFITITILLLDKAPEFPFSETLRKIKYLYLALVILYFLQTFDWKIKKSSITAVIIPMIMISHTVLFGLIFTNPDVKQATSEHFREMSIMIAIIIFTAYFFMNEDLYKEYIRLTYYAILIMLLWCAVKRPSHFVNPLYFIYVLSSDHSYRADFGVGHANFLGNICACALMYSIFILRDIRGENKLRGLLNEKKAGYIIFADALICAMLFSTQSRTSILGLGVFLVIYVIFSWEELFDISVHTRNVAIITVAMIGIAYFLGGGFDKIWGGAHRSQNIEVNYPIFLRFSKWTGMGYIAPSGFFTNAYGYGTFALDIYYLYILYTTGYIGLSMIIAMFAVTLVGLIKNTLENKDVCVLALFASILFLGIGQTNIFNYTLETAMFNWTIILMTLSRRDQAICRK